MARKAVAKTTQPKKNASDDEATSEGNEPVVRSKASKGKKKETVGGGSRQRERQRKAGDVAVESVDRDSRMDGSDEAQSNNDQLEAEARGGNATGKARSRKKVTFVEPMKAGSKKEVSFITFPLPEDLLSDDELKQKYPDVRLQKWMTTKRNLELVSRLHANTAQELEVVDEGPVETEKQASCALKDTSFMTGFNAHGKSLEEFIAIHMVVPPSFDDILCDKDAGVSGSKAVVVDKQRIAATITKHYTRSSLKKCVADDVKK